MLIEMTICILALQVKSLDKGGMILRKFGKKLLSFLRETKRKKFHSRLFPPKTLYQFVDLPISNPTM